MGRNYTRVGRLFRITQAIRSKRGLTAKDLASICQRHVRTIYRDIDVLNESGIPCARDGDNGGYVLRQDFFMPPVELTFDEALAMVALLEQTGREDQIPFLDLAQRAAEKIRSQLPPKIIDELEPIDGRITIDLARGSGDDSPRDVYDDIRHAIGNRRLLRCTYDSAHSQHDDPDGEFDFKPYQLWYCQRAWYAVGHHSRRNEVRMLKLNRFTYLKRTDQPYHIPDDFKLSTLIGNAWRMIRGPQRYEIAIRFLPTVADSVTETRWHPTQQEELHEDGSVTLRFSIDGLDEIVWWVLGYGFNATVLEPPELATMVRKQIKAMGKNYGK
jgi:predicted DNA-binding transcriptional regulator YafY